MNLYFHESTTWVGSQTHLKFDPSAIYIYPHNCTPFDNFDNKFTSSVIIVKYDVTEIPTVIPR